MRLLKNILSNRIFQHLMFWVLAYFVLLVHFSDAALEKVDYIYTFLFVVTLQMAVYTHRLLIIWRLKSKQLFYFFNLSWGIVVTFALFNYYFFDVWVDKVLPGYYFISYYSIWNVMLYFLVFIVLTTFLKLSKDWWLQEDVRRKLVLLEKEKAELELKALMAQVNPHFLFNSLNVLYALAIKRSEESPEAILKLSNVLRYVIYDSRKELVKVSDELSLIKNYLSLQNYRTDNKTEVQFIDDIQVDNKIAPLLFLPLIENSFKHGVKGDTSGTFVKINLFSDENTVNFNIINNKGKAVMAEKNERYGIGLENIRQRLNLLYPYSSEFHVNDGVQDFEVRLKIELK